MFRRRSSFEDSHTAERRHRQALGFGGSRHLFTFRGCQRVVKLNGFQDSSTGKSRWRCALGRSHGIHLSSLFNG